jgi:hypothetical protein
LIGRADRLTPGLGSDLNADYLKGNLFADAEFWVQRARRLKYTACGAPPPSCGIQIKAALRM